MARARPGTCARLEQGATGRPNGQPAAAGAGGARAAPAAAPRGRAGTAGADGGARRLAAGTPRDAGRLPQRRGRTARGVLARWRHPGAQHGQRRRPGVWRRRTPADAAPRRSTDTDAPRPRGQPPLHRRHLPWPHPRAGHALHRARRRRQQPRDGARTRGGNHAARALGHRAHAHGGTTKPLRRQPRRPARAGAAASRCMGARHAGGAGHAPRCVRL